MIKDQLFDKSAENQALVPLEEDQTIVLSMSNSIGEESIEAFTSDVAGVNVVVEKASKLLAIMMQLRAGSVDGDPELLHDSVVDLLHRFQKSLEEQEYPRVKVLAARYCLCAALDEFALNTEFASEGGWASKSMLNTFFNETWGGEKFFVIVERLMQNPDENIELLELLYICIRLGFEGRFKVTTGGRDELIEWSDNLYHSIRRERGEYSSDISASWEGSSVSLLQAKKPIPNWFIGLAFGVIAAATFLFVSTEMSQDIKPHKENIVQLLAK